MVACASQCSLTVAEMLGLLTACPWTQTNPPDCALYEVRRLPLAERYRMIRGASATELGEFASACATCLHQCPRAGQT